MVYLSVYHKKESEKKLSYVFIEGYRPLYTDKKFLSACLNIEQNMISKLASSEGWGRSHGGIDPGRQQFGHTTILPEWFADANGDVLDRRHVPATWGTNSFRQLFTGISPTVAAIPGWKTILQGGKSDEIGNMPNKVALGLVGFAITSKVNPITKLKLQIGTEKGMIIDIEQMKAFNKPSMVFEKGWEVFEQDPFELRGFFEASGYVRVVPLGPGFYKEKSVVIRE